MLGLDMDDLASGAVAATGSNAGYACRGSREWRDLPGITLAAAKLVIATV